MFLGLQEAQLLQRDRATFCVIEYFAKSLNVIWNDTIEQGATENARTENLAPSKMRGGKRKTDKRGTSV